jgi:hypothetical protein
MPMRRKATRMLAVRVPPHRANGRGLTPETEVPVQNDSSIRRRERVASGIYVRNGVYSAGFSDPNTGRWTMANLEASTLASAKKERVSLLVALREGRAVSRSALTSASVSIRIWTR